MSRKYKFYDNKKVHFVSLATVGWVDLFTRRIYFEVITDSFSYCIKHKGLILNAWCIMTNHVHLIIRSEDKSLSGIMRDMKKFTSKELIKTIQEHPKESRKERLLRIFEQAGQENKNNSYYQLWQQHNHPIELSTNNMMNQRLDYLHMNPVKAGFVKRPQDWLFSSAKNYAGLQGLLNLELAL
ncbi:REP-associated tyrosine transposase [Fodinibius halophilus]|uniref:Transposase n=1 Tax=Fodinibius halophilus TaxID=1736908 RepID=A0A6M1T6C0_9BACT|nr:transposase [Fodinibius halophilus]NGP88845.1 transposase [Fodinibius halophilus]